MTPQKIKKILKILKATWPDAKCELKSNNDFQFLLAVMLSAQTTDKAVNKALAPLLNEKPDFDSSDLMKMGAEKFLEKIKTIGLAPTKSKNAVKTAEILTIRYEKKVPLKRAELESLPGVGRKTANVVLAHLAGENVIAVDTHVARVSQRIGLVSPTDDRTKIEKELMKIIPKKLVKDAHHSLIFHGRYLCFARNPKCAQCPLEKICLKQQAVG